MGNRAGSSLIRILLYANVAPTFYNRLAYIVQYKYVLLCTLVYIIIIAYVSKFSSLVWILIRIQVRFPTSGSGAVTLFSHNPPCFKAITKARASG
jgi:hypothetical protein